MDNIESVISILKTCLQLCIGFAILFFIISVVLFFVFDIRTVFSIRTGRAQKKTIKDMQEANSTTGRLRIGKKTVTSQLSEKDRLLAQGKTPVQLADNPQITEEIGDKETEVLYSDAAPTDVLSHSSQQYTQQNQSDGMTTPLSQSDHQESYVPRAEYRDVHFTVTKKTVIVFTEEMIS